MFLGDFVDSTHLAVSLDLPLVYVRGFAENTDSIFNQIDEEKTGFEIWEEDNDKEYTSLIYYNFENFNILVYMSPDSMFDFRVKFWKQDIKIPLNKEFLTEWLTKVIDTLQSQDVFKAKFYYKQYEKYFVDNLWKELIGQGDSDNNELKEFLGKEFK